MTRDQRHNMISFLADWFLLSLPPKLLESTLTEIWDKEYDYIARMDDKALAESAYEVGYGREIPEVKYDKH